MSMQPSQQAYTAVQARLAEIGASTEVAKNLSANRATNDAVSMLDKSLSSSTRSFAIDMAAGVAVKSGIEEKARYLNSIPIDEDIKHRTQRVHGHSGADEKYADVAHYKVSPRDYLTQWKESDPKTFETFSKAVKNIVQNVDALAKISPSTAETARDVDMIFGKVKLNQIAEYAVSMELKESALVAPPKPGGLKM